MTNDIKFQIRIELSEAQAAIARREPHSLALAPLPVILNRHYATLKCQFDAFADYVAEAEKHGAEQYPLYAWTKATIEDPAKKAKYIKSFTLYVDGEEVYAKEKADALESDLRPLADGGQILRLMRYDTNPANNPQPPQRHRT
jgi:hypothetical protein